MSLQVLLFAVVIVSQCVIPSLQLPRTNEQPTVLEIFQKAFVTKNCKTVLIDPNKSDFLNQCNVPLPDLTNNITGSNVISYLCMTYYDVNLKICDRLATDQAKFQSHLPQSKEEIQNITSHFDTVEIADEFCKHNHSNIGQSEYAETKQYVKVFAMAISEQHLCTHACLDFFGKLNSFCKMIFWATLKLSDHDEASTKFTQMDNIIKNSLKQGLPPAVDQHIVPVAAKLPITTKQQETALPEGTANGGSDDFSLISSKELVKDTYETNVVFSAPDRMNGTPIIGGGLPQRPQGPKVDMVPLKTSGKEVSLEKETLLEKTLSPDKKLSPEKTLSPEKNLSPEKTLSPEKNLSPEKTLSPEKINSAEKESTVEKTVPPVKEIPKKTTLDKEAVVVNVPPPAPSKVEEETNNSEDEDMESPTLLDEGVNKHDNDFGDDSEPDLPVKMNGEVERGEEREGAESAVGAAGGAAPVENPTIEHIGGQGYTSEGEFVGSEDSHFFPYFLFASSILIVGYIIFHNKNKVLGLLLEGRRGEGRRRCPGGGPAYRKLDCTLEEAVSSAPPSHQPHIVY